MNHFPERRLKHDTMVAWSRFNPKGAIVFVHGYMGKAIGTWQSFEAMLPTEPKAQQYDLYFYGYDCVNGNTTASASLLGDFLEHLVDAPEQVAQQGAAPGIFRQDGFRYGKIVLVGHSIGAIVCRRALLRGWKQGKQWMAKTKLVLFAPAHRGAIVSELLEDLKAGSWFSFLRAGWNLKSPLVREVDPKSPSIAQLISDIDAAWKAKQKYVKAERVIVAEVDRVVSNLGISIDAQPDAIPRSTHTSVCKPKPALRDPLMHLLKEL
jgi:pimeloyl-ACP methyl ester carboxylesterase